MKYTLVDTFADRILSGFTCAVCESDTPCSPAYMRGWAMELAVPDTVFIEAYDWHTHTYIVHPFNPYGADSHTGGHVLLAAAHVVLEQSPHLPYVRFEDSARSRMWVVERCEALASLSMAAPIQVVLSCTMHPLMETLSWAYTPVFVGHTEDDLWVECATQEDTDRITTFDYSVVGELLRQTGKKGLVCTVESQGVVTARHMVQRGWHIIERPIADRAYKGLLPFWREREVYLDALDIQGAHLSMVPTRDCVRIEGSLVSSYIGHSRP